MKQRKKALLVYPKVPEDTFWSFKHALKFVHKKSSMPPLGLVTVAALFPEHWDLKLVDLNVERLKDKDLVAADAVFISAMIVQKNSMAEVIQRARAAGKPVIAGGPYPTSTHERIEGVDHFVLGEAEEIFPGFMEDFENGRAQRIYRAEKRPDITESIVPRFDLLKRRAYASMTVQYSRGCPFHCEFCDIWKMYGNRPRLKSSQSMLRELQVLFDLGWHGAVFIVDDNFIGNKGRVKKDLLPAMAKWQKARKNPFRFFTEASINLAADEELLSLMNRAGFGEVFIGIETPCEESLKETGKVQNLKTNMADAVATIQSYGIEVMAGFIMGFDHDTEDVADRQISFIQATGIPQAMVGLLTALPGTDLYARLSREGRILSDSDGDNVTCDAMNFATKMDRKAVVDGYAKVLSTIYDKNLKNYFDRCSQVLDSVSQSEVLHRQIRFQELATAARSLVRQPFTPYGLQYIKFLARNLVKNTGAFSQAVKYGIIGHHFYVITQKTVRPTQALLMPPDRAAD